MDQWQTKIKPTVSILRNKLLFDFINIAYLFNHKIVAWRNVYTIYACIRVIGKINKWRCWDKRIQADEPMWQNMGSSAWNSHPMCKSNAASDSDSASDNKKVPMCKSTLSPRLQMSTPQLKSFRRLKRLMGPTTHSLSTSFRGWCSTTCPGQICPGPHRGIIDLPNIYTKHF